MTEHVTSEEQRPRHLRCAGYSTVAVALALLWQFLTVDHNFGGNWTALYHTGAYLETPAGPEFEGLYQFPDTWGYDGQFYHYIAHDPLLRKGLSRYVDGPRLRWRRILIPALVHVLALGDPRFITPAFLVVILGFLFAGVYWSSRYCSHYGRHPACGLAFLLVPAVLVSIERLTVDLALVALCAGYALYASAEPSWKVYPILLLAPLVRETGLLLIAAYSLFHLIEKRWGRAAWAASLCLPWLAWVWFVHRNTPADPTSWTSAYPLLGILKRTVSPLAYRVTTPKEALAAGLDYVAVLGIWIAFALTVQLLWTRKLSPVTTALCLFMLLAAFVDNSKVWAETYAFGRALSPALLWLGMAGVTHGSWTMLAPLGMVLPRVAAQLLTHLPGIVFGLLFD